MDYVTNEYEAECVEYDGDDEGKICSEVSNISLNEKIAKNESFEKDSLSMGTRSSMIEKLQKLSTERHELKFKNIYLQKRIRNFFMKSRNLNALEKTTIDSVSIHSDYRYKQVLDEYEAFEIKMKDTNEENNRVIKQHQDLYESRVADSNLIFEELQSKLSEIRLKIKSHGCEETKDPVSDLLNKLQKLLEVLTNVRIKYFKFKYRHKELQSLIKTQTQLPEKYSLVNYENLKTMKSIQADKYEENQTYLKTIQEKLNFILNVLGRARQDLDVITNEAQMDEAQLKQLHSIEKELRMQLIEIKKLFYLKQNKLNELKELNTSLTWAFMGKLNNSMK